MKTHYEYYLLGCRASGVEPVSLWRFQVAYAKYRRELRHALDQRLDLLPTRDREKIVGRWTRLAGLARLVERGREIAARASRYHNPDDEPGTAGAGDREPRTPLTPVLAGCAARPLPTDDTMKERDEWRV